MLPAFISRQGTRMFIFPRIEELSMEEYQGNIKSAAFECRTCSGYVPVSFRKRYVKIFSVLFRYLEYGGWKTNTMVCWTVTSVGTKKMNCDELVPSDFNPVNETYIFCFLNTFYLRIYFVVYYCFCEQRIGNFNTVWWTSSCLVFFQSFSHH